MVIILAISNVCCSMFELLILFLGCDNVGMIKCDYKSNATFLVVKSCD